MPWSVETDEFSAHATFREQGISVQLSGTADLLAKKVLDEFLAKLHLVAQERRAKEVIVDLKELKFLNSSCLKGIVTWISNVKQLAAENQYQIVLMCNPDRNWQRRSLMQLWSLANELVTIQS